MDPPSSESIRAATDGSLARDCQRCFISGFSASSDHFCRVAPCISVRISYSALLQTICMLDVGQSRLLTPRWFGCRIGTCRGVADWRLAYWQLVVGSNVFLPRIRMDRMFESIGCLKVHGPDSQSPSAQTALGKIHSVFSQVIRCTNERKCPDCEGNRKCGSLSDG